MQYTRHGGARSKRKASSRKTATRPKGGPKGRDQAAAGPADLANSRFLGATPPHARATAALFTREEAGEPEQHLRDMQASWYELEVGSALARRVTTGSPAELRELAGPALKLFLSVEKHFSDFVEDQFDFHTYCAVCKSNFTARSC